MSTNEYFDFHYENLGLKMQTAERQYNKINQRAIDSPNYFNKAGFQASNKIEFSNRTYE